MAISPVLSAAVLTPEQREARRIAANTLPQGTSITGPLAGGDPLAFGTDNTFRVGDSQEVRVVDAGGNVIFSGAGAEGANRAVAVAQSLSDELGGDANFKIQTGERTINPDGSVGGTRYIDVARAAPMQSGLGFLADNVLPFAASFIPGVGPVIGAALGSAASSAIQGRDLEDALARAALAGGTAYLGGQVFGPATPGSTAPTDVVNSDLIPNALQGLNFGPLASASIPAGVGGAVGDIVVNAATRAATSAVPNILASTAGNVLGQTVLPEAAQPTPAEQPATTEPEEIVVTGNVPTVIQDPGLGSALAGLPSILAPMTPDPALTGEMPSGDKFDFNDVLGTGLSIPQLLSIGGIGADLLGNLLGGSGGAGAGTPYVSPFGTGVGFGTGQDMRANPNIADYERYGFGPEAMFFQPQYTGLLPANAAPLQTQPAMTVNPALMPLI